MAASLRRQRRSKKSNGCGATVTQSAKFAVQRRSARIPSAKFLGARLQLTTDSNSFRYSEGKALKNSIVPFATLLSFVIAIVGGPALAQSSAAGAMGQYRREQAERAQRAAAALANAKAEASRRASEQRSAKRDAAERQQWKADQREAATAERARLAREALDEQRSAERAVQKGRCEVAIRRSAWAAASSPCLAASALNDPEAQYYLARMKRDGMDTGQDYGAALQLFKQSAQIGFYPSVLELCKLVHQGKGVTKNLSAAAECYAKLDSNDYNSSFQIIGEGYRDIRQEARELLVTMYFDGEARPPVPTYRAKVELTSEFRSNLVRRMDMLSPRNQYQNYFSRRPRILEESLKFTVKLWINGNKIEMCRADSPKRDAEYEKRICDAIGDQSGSSLLIQNGTNADGLFVGDLVSISM